jgi:signal transduction histidine kinase
VVKNSHVQSSQTSVIRGDRNQLQHLLINLLINALDAMGRKGMLLVGIEGVSNGHFVRIRISDTGIGIPPELHSKIFQPYFTTKPKNGGTGLGLSVSRYIVEEHGGRLDFYSKVGKGTTFIIDLPAHK